LLQTEDAEAVGDTQRKSVVTNADLAHMRPAEETALKINSINSIHSAHATPKHWAGGGGVIRFEEHKRLEIETKLPEKDYNEVQTAVRIIK